MDGINDGQTKKQDRFSTWRSKENLDVATTRNPEKYIQHRERSVMWIKKNRMVDHIGKNEIAEIDANDWRSNR